MAQDDFSKEIKNYREKLVKMFKDNGFDVIDDKDQGFIIVKRDNLLCAFFEIYPATGNNSRDLKTGEKKPILKLEGSTLLGGLPNLTTFERLRMNEITFEETGVFVKHLQNSDYMAKIYNYFYDEIQLYAIAAVMLHQLADAAQTAFSFVRSKKKK